MLDKYLFTDGGGVMNEAAKSDSEKLASDDAVEIARKIKTGEVTAKEVVEAHIRRIEVINPKLNALVIPLFDQALAQAKEADEQQAKGKPLGSLHGIPITIKDQFNVAGTQTTLGLENQVDIPLKSTNSSVFPELFLH